MTTTNTDSPSKNVVNWFEIPVTDIQKAASLYAAMLDLKLEISDFGGVPHAVFPHAGQACVSGALVSDAKRPPKRGSGTVIYLNATDGLASCLARAQEAGAKIVQAATAIGQHGSIALIEDLDGNVIGLHEEPKP
jgi:predicted enzyme related to lactoylglutathione lyase